MVEYLLARLKVQGLSSGLGDQGLAGLTLHVEIIAHVINMTD